MPGITMRARPGRGSNPCRERMMIWPAAAQAHRPLGSNAAPTITPRKVAGSHSPGIHRLPSKTRLGTMRPRQLTPVGDLLLER
jgi:hypothetical protein